MDPEQAHIPSPDELDPRIKGELETLNAAADCVNKLENELQAARAKFIRDKACYAQRLDALREQLGTKNILKAHPYYELVLRSRKLQSETRRSAEKYSAACTACERAKHMLKCIEQWSLPSSGGAAEKAAFDSNKLEAMNEANEELVNSEKEKVICETSHRAKTAEYLQLQQQTAAILKDLPKAINRAKAYFNLKDQLESQLQALKQTAEDLSLALLCSKDRYRSALATLEAISEELHEQRQMMLQPRTPGVGAEAVDEMADWPSVTIEVDSMSMVNSQHLSNSRNSSVESFSSVQSCDMVPSVLDHQLPQASLPSQTISSDTASENQLSEDCQSYDISKKLTSELQECHVEDYVDITPSCSDRQGDGAEDSITKVETFDNLKLASEDQLVTEGKSDDNDALEKSSRQNVNVSALQSGIYIARTQYMAHESSDFVGGEGKEVHAKDEKREKRRQQIAHQFPILNLHAASLNVNHPH